MLAGLSDERVDAHPLAPNDVDRLNRGELVVYPQDVEVAEGAYFGGISYVVVDASPAHVMAVLTDASAYRRLLPYTIEARVTGNRGDDSRVFFRQGNNILSVAYSLWIRRESLGLIRFWVDLDVPHDIADCWGFFRVTPWQGNSSLLTFGGLLRLDPGLIKLLFSEQIRGAALRAPLLVRKAAHRRTRSPK
jgi:hypothetical protein